HPSDQRLSLRTWASKAGAATLRETRDGRKVVLPVILLYERFFGPANELQQFGLLLHEIAVHLLLAMDHDQAQRALGYANAPAGQDSLSNFILEEILNCYPVGVVTSSSSSGS